MILQLKIEFYGHSPGVVRSLSKMQVVRISDFDKCLSLFTSILDRECILESNQNITSLFGRWLGSKRERGINIFV